MSNYILNKTNLAVVIIFGLLFALSVNEVAKLVGRVQERNIVFYNYVRKTHSTVFETQESCQKQTLRICNFEQCDYIPLGQTFDEVCGEDFIKGWRPTNVEIPRLFQNIVVLRLTMETPDSLGEIEIRPREETIRYTSTPRASDDTPVQQITTVRHEDITRVANKMILYELANPTNERRPDQDDETIYSIYVASSESGHNNLPFGSSALADQIEEERTMRCALGACPRDFLDVVKEIARLWDGEILELS